MSGTVISAEADTVAAGGRIGTVVGGKYRLERLLGRGGMGEVYEARHLVVGRRFALKLLHAELAKGRLASERFLREARAAGSLESEHIAAVVDFGMADDGTPFFVMELLSGSSLAGLRSEGPLAVPRAAGLLLQACRGLEVAHQAGIVHRDLKPDNLFVVRREDGSELLKILDFGVAKFATEQSPELTQSGAVLGTPFYMAPEQARGEKTVDGRVDIHALGVIGYELLSGERPHPGDSYNAILAHILTQPFVPLASLRVGLPDALVKLIEQALAFDPAARPATAAAFAARLKPFVTREVVGLDSQFDLRPRVAATSAEADTSADMTAEPGATGSTLASASREIEAQASTSSAKPLTRSLLVAAALLAGVVGVVVKLAGGVTTSPEATRSTAASSNPSSIASQLPTAATTPSSAPTVSQPASAAASGSGTAAPAGSPPRPRAPRATATAREVSFDETNPY